MAENKYIVELERRFASYAGDMYGIAKDIYEYIVNAPEELQINLFSIACERFATTESDASLSVTADISEEELESLKNTYGDLVNAALAAIIKNAIKLGVNKDGFYSIVWESVVQNGAFPDEEARCFALYYILIDKRIPFYPITTGLEMSNDTYRDLVVGFEEELHKINFILSCDFEQKTSEASNLLDEILKQETYEKQVVLFSLVLQKLRVKQKQLLDIIQELQEDTGDQ